MKKYQPEQLTFLPYGHTLHHCQVISPDDQWIVYDTRNEDSAIGITTRIERVNINTKEIEVLYEATQSSQFGPGVGAVSYAPNKDQVIFIHGLNNANQLKPYQQSRRTGVGVDCSKPNQVFHYDARDCVYPYTDGALRGGTHSHCWHMDGNLISFTYNDEVAELNNLQYERTVGVMFPKKVNVPYGNTENFSGSHYSFLVSSIVSNAENDSDQIEKAFDECWVGNTNSLVFQGFVRDFEGKRKTEIFLVQLPENLELIFDESKFNLESGLPQIPKVINQTRVTFTPKGISTFRHWLRSSPDGNLIYFLMENESNITNIYSVNLDNKELNQVTFHDNSIHSPFNISPDGSKLTYLCNHSLIVFDTIKRSFKVLIGTNPDLYGIPNFDKKGEFIIYNQYMFEDSTSKFLQIFRIKL